MLKRRIEFQNQHRVKMLRLERRKPLLQRHQQRRRILRPQEFQRMRVKRNRHASSIQPARLLDHSPQNLAMPKMHAVENTHR